MASSEQLLCEMQFGPASLPSAAAPPFSKQGTMPTDVACVLWAVPMHGMYHMPWAAQWVAWCESRVHSSTGNEGCLSCRRDIHHTTHVTQHTQDHSTCRGHPQTSHCILHLSTCGGSFPSPHARDELWSRWQPPQSSAHCHSFLLLSGRW